MSIFRNFAVIAITLISTVNTLGSSYLNQRQIKDSTANTSESVETTEFQEDVSSSTEATSEETNTINETTTVATTEIAMTTSESAEVITTTETQQPISTEKYEISSIAKLNNGDINSFQSYAIDTDSNAIYYIDKNFDNYYENVVYYIYKYDIQSESVEIVKELPYSSNLHPICLTYNQYDKNTYCFAGGGEWGNGLAFFNVESNEFQQLNTNGNRNFLSFYNHFENTEYRSFYFISPTEFVIELEQGDYHSRLYLYNTIDDSFNSGSIGVYSANRKNETDTPFIYNDNYYWLCTRNYGFSIIKSQKLFYPLQSGADAYYGDNLKQFDTSDGWIAGNVYNNDVYLMKKDFSIYKVDLDILEQLYNESNQVEKSDNLINTPNNDDESNKALTLYIDGAEIKQTGINNLTDIKYFSFISDSSILVYDDFDKTYKLISAIE